jgi:hypothetical protein
MGCLERVPVKDGLGVRESEPERTVDIHHRSVRSLDFRDGLSGADLFQRG